MRISSKNAICLSVVGFLTVLTAICGTGEVAQASTFYVDSTDDTVDATPGDGVCDDGAGSCSLRAAIMEANALVGADIIDAPAGTYTLTIPGERENAALTGDLDITDELTITGAGESSTIIDGGGIDRVLEVIAAGNITDITIQNGAGSFEEAAGAGIYNTSQQLTLNNVTIIGNQTGIYNGGVAGASTILADTSIIGNSPGSGIVNYGTVEIRNAAIQGNTSADWGGGIKNTGTMTIDNSLISGNSALGDHAYADIGGFGGGIYISGNLTISNTTISGNSAEDNGRGGAGKGGGIYASFNRLILDHVTIADNHASIYSDLFLGAGARMQQKSTIIANNLGGDNCGIFGAFTNLGNNLDSGNSCGFMEPSDLVNTDPLLGPLQDNGGPTFTHALLPGSPAIDHILPVNCIVTTDQRGVSRPSGVGCDIGAYELDIIFADGFEQ